MEQAVRGCLDEDTIHALFHAKLSRAELAELDLHIDGCAACRTLLSALAERDPGAPPVTATELATRAERSLDEGAVPITVPGDARLHAGEVLGDRFVLEARVGAGGMAEVYAARDRASGTKVAVKVPLSTGAHECARFEREARVLVQLSHPAIVRHLANGRGDDEMPYLAMDWLEGQDLAGRLRQGPLSVEETLALGARIASALAAAHAVGIVHRDVKPSNIFLRDGDVRGATLIDFGVARQADAMTASLATRTGMFLGTLGYMAPEQARGPKKADARSDMFSLGCVLFEALTGRRLFDGAHFVEVLAKLLTEPIPSPRSIDPRIPAALDALVVGMLRRTPEERPPDCAWVASELERIRVAGGVLAAALPRPAPAPARRTATAVVALVLAGAAVAAAGIAVQVRRAHRAASADSLALPPAEPSVPGGPLASGGSSAPAPSSSAQVASPSGLDAPPAAASATAPSGLDASAAASSDPAPRPRQARPRASASVDPFGNSRY